jgi:hypothetical protein
MLANTIGWGHKPTKTTGRARGGRLLEIAQGTEHQRYFQ